MGRTRAMLVLDMKAANRNNMQVTMLVHHHGEAAVLA
jgi:hypothetical protein